jgi:hypothetical protein
VQRVTTLIDHGQAILYGVAPTAVFDATRTYRYLLTRWWADGPQVGFVMLNPSTADAMEDDPTIRRCIGFAQAWGYGSLAVANVFAYRSTHPDDLLATNDPVGPDNDAWIARVASACPLVVCAWGSHRTTLKGRGAAVRAALGDRAHYLRLTKDGSPGHPLYLKGSLRPEPWR